MEKHHCQEEEKRAGLTLQVLTSSQTIAAKLKKADIGVIFTTKVSHSVKTEAMQAAKSRDIPVFMHHACGVCTLRRCLACFAAKNQ